MIRANELRGRAVIDLDAAEKIGHVDEVLLDPENSRVAGFILSQGQSFFGSGTSKIVLPAALVHAVGPDALTVRTNGALQAESDSLARMPRMSDINGRRIVSQSGKLLGTIEDALIEAETGRIVGYAIGRASTLGTLENLFSGAKDSPGDYVRGDADLRVGKDFIVAPDDAVIHGGQQDSHPSMDWEDERLSAGDPAVVWPPPPPPNAIRAWGKQPPATQGRIPLAPVEALHPGLENLLPTKPE